MSQLISIFPLQLVAFPEEVVPLHIFEPRYRRMIHAAENQGDPFGIVPVHNRKVAQTGTLMELQEVARRYDDGRLDVICQGTVPFTVLRFLVESTEDVAHRAEVVPLTVHATADALLQQSVLQAYERFHELIKTENLPELDPAKMVSFQLGHTCGLSVPQQINLMELATETERLTLLKEHLERVIPTLENIERTRDKVRQNGHFKVLPGVDFQFE